MTGGQGYTVDLTHGVLTHTFDRPETHNAMTWAMYDGLRTSCERADADPDVHVLVLASSSAHAFVAGSDIAQFQDFKTGRDGIDYESRITTVINRVEEVNVPTIAAIRGYCLGGGLAIAAACDLRIASTTARFGVPIARTLGNCLSSNSMSLLLFHLGPARTADILLRARILDAQEARDAGFVCEVTADDKIKSAIHATIDTLVSHAPITMWAAKELTRRARRALVTVDDDVISRTYASADFASGVQHFTRREPPNWTGR